MDRPETQCRRTCREIFPHESELWCSGCVCAEAEDRESNMRRWQERARRENLARWTARFSAQQEDAL